MVVNPLFQAKKSTFSTLPSCTNVGANCIKLFERIIIYYLRYIIAKIDEKNIYLSFCFLSSNKSKFYFPIVYICSTSKGTTFLPLPFFYFYLLDENVIFLPKNFGLSKREGAQRHMAALGLSDSAVTTKIDKDSSKV